MDVDHHRDRCCAAPTVSRLLRQPGRGQGEVRREWIGKKSLDVGSSRFLDRLGHKARRQMCPLYVSGLIGPGDRKSIQPMAERLTLGDYDQLHHFIAAGVWDATPVETELLVQADRLVGGSDAVLVIDDTGDCQEGHAFGGCRSRNMLRRSARPPIARLWCR
jgi:DDE superfamily endonuclease